MDAESSRIRFVPGEERYAEGLRAAMNAIGHEGQYMGFIEAPPVETVRAIIRQVAALDGVQRLAIDEADRVVGWCQVARPVPASLRHTGQLGIGVVAEHRGSGVARALARDTLAAARALGIERIELDVFTTNLRAQRFFRSLGFVDEGTRRAAYKVDGQYLDTHAMALVERPQR